MATYKTLLEQHGFTLREMTAEESAVSDAILVASRQNERRSNMPDTTILSKAEIDKIQKEARAKNNKLLAAMIAEFPCSLQYAVDQFCQGSSLVEAQANSCDMLKEQLAAERQNRKPVGATPVAFGESAGDVSDDALVEQVKTLAAAEGISKKEALKRLHEENPDLLSGSQNR